MCLQYASNTISNRRTCVAIIVDLLYFALSYTMYDLFLPIHSSCPILPNPLVWIASLTRPGALSVRSINGYRDENGGKRDSFASGAGKRVTHWPTALATPPRPQGNASGAVRLDIPRAIVLRKARASRSPHVLCVARRAIWRETVSAIPMAFTRTGVAAVCVAPPTI